MAIPYVSWNGAHRNGEAGHDLEPAPFQIPSLQWHNVTEYNLVNLEQDGTGDPYFSPVMSDGQVEILRDGTYALAAYVSTKSRSGNLSMRFVRNAGGPNEDATGHTDFGNNRNNTYQTSTWFNRLSAGTKMSVQLLSSSRRPTLVRFVQFKMTILRSESWSH